MNLPDEVRSCFASFDFGAPCPEGEIRRAESELGETLSPVLKRLYLAFDGFRGPTDAAFFWPLFSHEENEPGLVEINLFYRRDNLFPQGLVSQCLFFGDDGCGPQWGIKRDMPNKVILWDAEWGNEFEVAGDDPLEVWVREKNLYEKFGSEGEA